MKMVVMFLLVGLLAFLVGYNLPKHDKTRQIPVCHSVTEDSTITDCDYNNGTWYHKN